MRRARMTSALQLAAAAAAVCAWIGGLPAAGAAAAISDEVPRLSFVSKAPLNMGLPTPKTSFEGGTVVRTDTGLHLFTTDTTRGVVNTSLVYYHSADVANGTFTFVRQVACCSEGVLAGHRASLWAPMPVYDEADDIWRLFYVQYSSSIPAANKSGWFYNYDGQIASAVSATKGRGGIGGPYSAPAAGPSVVLKPGADSQAWEGLQGTDSISPPFLLPDKKTWAAWYGSAQTEKVPNPRNIVSAEGLRANAAPRAQITLRLLTTATHRPVLR
eukprot:SAG22_NODE_933_length_6434_cov_5.195264_4_plen_272_part_00